MVIRRILGGIRGVLEFWGWGRTTTANAAFGAVRPAPQAIEHRRACPGCGDPIPVQDDVCPFCGIDVRATESN